MGQLMFQKENLAREIRSGLSKPFMQPLALTLICVLFISLILVTGLMDLGRLDRTLVSSMENRGIEIMAFVQKEAQDNYSSFLRLYTMEHEGTLSLPGVEPFLIQETFINNFVAAVRRFEKDPSLENNPAAMEALLSKNGIPFFAIMDGSGRVVFKNRDIPPDVIFRANPVIVGEREILIDLFNPSKKKNQAGFVALRRSNSEGTVIVALEQEGFEYWGKRVAVQTAVNDAAIGDIAFISIQSSDGKIFGSAGVSPPLPVSGVLPDWGNSQAKSRKITFRDRDYQEVLVPFYLLENLEGIGQIGLDRDKTDQIITKNRLHVIISMVLIVLTGVISILFIYQNQSRHLARLEELRKRLQQTERLSSLGQLAAGVAHEIRNPLNAISMATQRLQREFSPAESDRTEKFRKITGVIRDEVRRLNGIIEEFLAFSRTQRFELKDYPIEEVLRKLVSLIEEEANSKGIKMLSNLDGSSAIIPMDVDKLQQALLNILKNAMESISGEGEISIVLEKRTNEITLKISDTGAGLSQDEIEKIFNPEYTTKEKGLGLGLPIAHEIIRGHNGNIKVESRIGAGTTFTITLPSTAPPSGKVFEAAK